MSDKLVRDELLRSHRYQSLSSDTAKLLFFHLVLASDSLSNAEATTTALSIIMGRTIVEEVAATLLSELADKDLLRVYIVDKKRYVHIPRSRQRIRYLNGKHPRPPSSIEDQEISELIAKVGLQSDRGQSVVGRSEVKRSDVVVVEKLKSLVAAPSARPLATRLSENWRVPDEWVDWALEVRPDWSRPGVIRESISFRDFWIAKSGKDATKMNWKATWRTWIRRAEKEPVR